MLKEAQYLHRQRPSSQVHIPDEFRKAGRGGDKEGREQRLVVWGRAESEGGENGAKGGGGWGGAHPADFRCSVMSRAANAPGASSTIQRTPEAPSSLPGENLRWSRAHLQKCQAI